MNRHVSLSRISRAIAWHGGLKWWNLLQQQLAWSQRERQFRRVFHLEPEGGCSDRKALLCFVVENFSNRGLTENRYFHSHSWQCPQIAEVLLGQGFSVDITSWRNPKPPDARRYDIVVGRGIAFTQSLRRRRPDTRAIYLGTGTDAEQTRREELRRVREIEMRSGIVITPSLVDEDKGPEVADAVFVQGNEWVMETYRAVTKKPLYRLGTVVLDSVNADLSRKNYDEARRNFLWMAGYGEVRRRLDVLLEAFRQLRCQHLWICGSGYKGEFHDAYHNDLRNSPNVHTMGWTDLWSETFKEVSATCGYFLYPSTSDGDPGSVVNTMAAGLVPLVTLETGIDIGNCGNIIEDSSVEGIIRLVKSCSSVSVDEMKDLSQRSSAYAYSRFSKERAASEIRTGLLQCLSEWGLSEKKLTQQSNVERKIK